MPSLTSKIKAQAKKNTEPAWSGPHDDGITQSMVSSYLNCRERFRIRAIDGLQPIPRFNKAIAYGHMWHLCEECFARGEDYHDELKDYAMVLVSQWKTDQAEIDKWYNVCMVQFPVYVDFWERHKDVRRRKPLFQEKSFKIPYTLPSGRTVYMRGKFDSVDILGKEVWLQENKTKGQINFTSLERQLTYDLQTGFYFKALTIDPEVLATKKKVGGITYNVIRRPLSGGKGSIRPHKARGAKPAETLRDYYDRLQTIIEIDAKEEDGEQCTFFHRWKIEIEQKDSDRFCDTFLNPVLENVCDDYEWWMYCKNTGTSAFDYAIRSGEFPDHQLRHSIHPYGVYNVLNEGGITDIDEYLITGSTVGLTRVETMFPEL